MSYKKIRKIIYEDDIKKLRDLNIDVTKDHIRYSVVAGSINILKYLIEEREVIPCEKGITYAFSQGQFPSFFYLARKGFIYQIQLSWLFDDCRFTNKENLDKFDTIDISEFEDIFKVAIDTNTIVNMKLRVISALCKSLSYTITSEDLKMLAIANKFNHCLPSDYYYIIENNNVEIPISNSHAGFLYGYGIDIKLPLVQKLSPVFTLPLTHTLVKNMPVDSRYNNIQVVNTCINNIIYHIKNYGIILDEFLFSRCDTQFDKILKYISLDYDTWLNWIKFSIRGTIFGPLLYHLKLLLEYNDSYVINLPEDNKQKLLIYILTEVFTDSLNDDIKQNLINIIITAFPSLLQSKWLNWDEIIKTIGNRESIYLKDDIIKNFPNIVPIINFDYVLRKEEKWAWFGISSSKIITYTQVPYDNNISINESFKDIYTISDIKDNISKLNKLIRSPRNCYFITELTNNQIFYRDCEDCLIWALNNNGYVYILNDDNPFEQIFVAKSLPEFLTRIYLESQSFYTHRPSLLPIDFDDY